MTFITGMLLIDAPASALNNAGNIPGTTLQNTVAVKYIPTGQDRGYPYISAQAFRYWLRGTLQNDKDWQESPIYKEQDENLAYPDANPVKYWDDDLFGYMRAPASSKQKERLSDPEYEKMTKMEMVKKDKGEKEATVTRASPFRVSTLVSLAPVRLISDFGVMARHEGDPVPYEHQFYRATLHGLFSLDLSMAGKFYYTRRTGFQNLDKVRRELAEQQGLTHNEKEKYYQFNRAERLKRVKSLLLGLGRLQGGAKQAIHYTDVSPAVVVLAVTSGGNHPFNYLFKEKQGAPEFQKNVFEKALEDSQHQLLSPVFVGWKPGYLTEQTEQIASVQVEGVKIEYSTPRVAFEQLAAWLESHQDSWDK